MVKDVQTDFWENPLVEKTEVIDRFLVSVKDYDLSNLKNIKKVV